MQLQIKELPGGFLSEISYKRQKESENVTEDVTEDVTKNVTENVTEKRQLKILELLKAAPTKYDTTIDDPLKSKSKDNSSGPG